MPKLRLSARESRCGQIAGSAGVFDLHRMLLIMLVIPAGCAAPQSDAADSASTVDATAVDTVAVRVAIDSLRARYEAAVASGDFASLGALVTEDVIAVGPGGPQWDSLRAASDSPWPPGATVDINPIEVRVLSHDWAYELGSSTATYTPRGSSERRTLQDTYMVLFRRTPSGWKLHREVASPALLPSQ
jgi:ketosteroid isomerase-like protein